MKSQGIRTSLAAALVAAVIGTSGAFAQDKTVDQKLQELQDQINVLQHQRELDREAAAATATNQAAKPPTAPYVKASQEGFSFQSADDNFNLRIRGYAQADGRF